MVTLNEGEYVSGYKVVYLIKKGVYNDTYRVSKDNVSYFMKLYSMDDVPKRLISEETGIVEEITACREIRHKNVLSYVNDGVYNLNGNDCQFLITDFFNGSLLSDKIRTSGKIPVEEAKQIFAGILSGLSYLHSMHYYHNDITPNNILLETETNGSVTPKIIDLGHIHKKGVAGAPPFLVDDLELEYCAPETLIGIFNDDSDVFAATAVFYTMLTGSAPWPTNISKDASYTERKKAAKAAWREDLNVDGIPEELQNLIQIGLSKDPQERVDVNRLLSDLFHPDGLNANGSSQGDTSEVVADRELLQKPNPKATGGGFKDVAGMDHLKEELNKRVIWVLKDKEKAIKYRLTPPNGMLLYGPPGCGKTFFAQKFAEESRFTFFMVNGSDLGSIYVHGTQGNIADLFNKAKKQAPCVICFDEFDAFVPSRSTPSAEHKADEVNEFLSQLNNCSKDGIFVIGTTNRIDMIDPAVLRKGRMDLKFEIPAPDKQTRSHMFELYLKDRPVAEDINYDELADKTDKYASSDIAFIVNEAAMMAALANEDITQTHLLNAIKCNPSSLQFLNQRPHVGFIH